MPRFLLQVELIVPGNVPKPTPYFCLSALALNNSRLAGSQIYLITFYSNRGNVLKEVGLNPGSITPRATDLTLDYGSLGKFKAYTKSDRK